MSAALPHLWPTCYDPGMCLGIPGKVISIDGLDATVDFFGVRRQVRLDVVDEPVAPGDYVLNHVGFAIRRIPESEVAETLTLFAELAAAGEDQDRASGGDACARAGHAHACVWHTRAGYRALRVAL